MTIISPTETDETEGREKERDRDRDQERERLCLRAYHDKNARSRAHALCIEGRAASYVTARRGGKGVGGMNKIGRLAPKELASTAPQSVCPEALLLAHSLLMSKYFFYSLSTLFGVTGDWLQSSPFTHSKFEKKQKKISNFTRY